jgi:hypothetical protein
MMTGGSDAQASGRASTAPPWQTYGLLVLGIWLIVSPLVLHDAPVTPAWVSGLLSGLALVALAAWSGARRRPVTPWVIALTVGLWLLVAPSLWEFGDGATTWQLVPSPLVSLPGVQVVEPTMAAIARARWNSVLAGLTTIALAGWVLAGTYRRRWAVAPGKQR